MSKDGVSSVTFLPYIGENFAKPYIISNYIGESLSSLIPSVLALAQGLGQNPGCHSIKDPATNATLMVPKHIVPNYSVKIYFILMFLILCLCMLAFTWLHFSKTAIKERETNELSRHKHSDNKDESSDQKEKSQPDEKKLAESVSASFKISTFLFNVDGGSHDNFEKMFLNGLTFLTSFIYYGILPGN